MAKKSTALILAIGLLAYFFGDRLPILNELFDQLVEQEQMASAPSESDESASLPESIELPQPTSKPAPIETVPIPESDSQLTCNGHLAYGMPSQMDQIICRNGYAVGYSYEAKGPAWVAYRLTRESISGDVERRDGFHFDSSIPAEYRASNDDFFDNGYDRGHMAPAESLDSSKGLMFESFYLSNTTPQLADFNRGAWKALEIRIRRWTERRGELYVVSGAIYDADEYIGNDLAVASQFYKIVYDPKANQALAFLLPHDDLDSDELADYLESIDTIESWGDIDALASLPDNVEVQLEGEAAASLW